MKVHTVYDPDAQIPTFFSITKAKRHDRKAVDHMPLLRLSSGRGRKECPTILRRICFVREEDGKKLAFVTNDLKRSAGAIAALYKQRWQIELFFRWIKQNLKIKRFMGTSENAVKIQIIIAMIAYLLLHMASSLLPTSRSMQQLARLFSVNLMQRRSLLELLADPPPAPKRRSAIIQHQMCLINA